MKIEIRSTVHPWYKGTHEWRVKAIAKLQQPIQYPDPIQGEVSYDPKILLLGSEKLSKVLWFTYQMATTKTGGKMRWGQGSPMLEQSVLLNLLKEAIKQGFFTKDVLKELANEVDEALNK